MAAGKPVVPAKTPEEALEVWIGLVNQKAQGEQANPRIHAALKWLDMCLYGDAELDIFMLPSEYWPPEKTIFDFVRYVQDGLDRDHRTRRQRGRLQVEQGVTP